MHAAGSAGARRTSRPSRPPGSSGASRGGRSAADRQQRPGPSEPVALARTSGRIVAVRARGSRPSSSGSPPFLPESAWEAPAAALRSSRPPGDVPLVESPPAFAPPPPPPPPRPTPRRAAGGPKGGAAAPAPAPAPRGGGEGKIILAGE